jgi:hypothetical protein
LDDLVAPDDPVRAFGALLDQVDWAPWEQAYAGCGQPPIHPRYLAGAVLYGLLHKIHSSRDLELASAKHLDFIWLLEGFTPDHSTFINFHNRHATSIGLLHRDVARALVTKRYKALLHLVIDGTRMRADSDRHGPRGAKAIEAVLVELERRLAELVRNDAAQQADTGYFDGMEPPQQRQELRRLDTEISRLERQRAKYQKALETARERDARARQHDGAKAKAVRVPVTDPHSQVTPNKDGGFAPNYTPVAAVEPQSGAIVHGDVLPGSDEASAVAPAVAALEALIGEKPHAVLADGNFASGPALDALDQDGIEAYMPTRSMTTPDNPALRDDPSTPVPEADRARLPKQGKQFGRTAFVYDAAADTYHCPMGHALTPYKEGKTKDGAHCVYYQCRGCPHCPLARDCLSKKARYRSISRDQYEPLRQAAAKRMSTLEGQAVYRTRAPGIETVFGFIKACLGIRRFARRGLENVRTEWIWICTAYNLKKLLALEARSVPGVPKTEKRPRHNGFAGPIKTLAARLLTKIRHHALPDVTATKARVCVHTPGMI